MSPPPSIPPPSLLEIETAIAEADALADELESLSLRRAHAALFARALRTTTRNLRLSLVAAPTSTVVLRLHLRLEGTMRRAQTELLDMDLPPSSRRVEEIPNSQRPTVPPPRGLLPSQLFAKTEEPPTVRPPPAASQIRSKAKFVSKKKTGEQS